MTTNVVCLPGVNTVSCHAWSPDRSMVAISQNDENILIFKGEDSQSSQKWSLSHKLSEHSQRVTSLDWCPSTGLLVSCAEDRNAYVWTYTPSSRSWDHQLVLLRMPKSATCVRWSPSGNKFAVGSSGHLISICHYDQENNWWISKHIKDHFKSTIMSLEWHPNGILLACGCLDGDVHVISGYIKGLDEK